MRTTYFKQLIIALFLLVVSAGTAAAASWKLSPERLNGPGSKDTLRAEIVDSDFQFSALQVDIQLPQGLTLEGAPLLDSRISAWSMEYNKLENGVIRLVIHEANNKVISAGSGELFRLPVKVDEAFYRGEVELSKTLLSRQVDEALGLPNQKVKVYALKTLKVSDVQGLEQMEGPLPKVSFTVVPAEMQDKMKVAYYTDENCKKPFEGSVTQPGLLYAMVSFAGDDVYDAFEQVYLIKIKAKQALVVSEVKGLEQMEGPLPNVSFTVVPAEVKGQMKVAYFTDDNCTTAFKGSVTQPGTLYAKVSFAGNETIAKFEQVYTITIKAKQALVVNEVKGLEQMEGSLKAISERFVFKTDPANLQMNVAYYLDKACTGNPLEDNAEIQPGTLYAKVSFAGNETIAKFEQIYPITINAKGKLVVKVSGLEQIYDEKKAAEISYTTVPANIELSANYYTDATCTTEATEADRKKPGVLYVKLTYAGNEKIAPFEQVYTLLLTDKKDLNKEENVSFTWPTATSIVKGQALGNALLTGGSVSVGELNVPGQFVWTDPSVKPAAGNGEYSVTFLPNNANYYKSVEETVALHVKDVFRLAVESGENGSAMLIGQTADGLYVEGEALTLKAVPDANYKFMGWTLRTSGEQSAGKESTKEIKVGSATAGTYVARFEPILWKVTKTVDGRGTLTVTVDEKNVNSGEQIQQGVTLKVVATADEGYQLEALTLNDQAMAGDKFTLLKDAALKAVFTEKPKERHTMTIDEVPNGSLIVYNENGLPIASGSTLEKGSEITVVALPAAGHQLQENSLKVEAGGSSEVIKDSKYTVAEKDFTVSVAFEAKQYAVSVKAVGTDGKDVGKKVTLDQSGNVAYGSAVKIESVSEDAKLVAIMANGKDYGTDWKNLSFFVTGKLEITAMFDTRVEIDPNYILWPMQEFYYNGTSRTFLPFISQAYAGLVLDVKYQKGNEEAIEKAINAGNYDVILSREQDALYNAFKHIYTNGLVIHKSPIRVTEVPKDANDVPKTYPETDKITKKETDNYIEFTIEPKETDKANYEGIVYYWEKPEAQKAKFTTGSRLRASSDGGVRVTNGSVLVEGDLLAVGMKVRLEAIPNEGYIFTKWSDGEKENPRMATITAYPEKNNFIPEFEGKKEISLSVKNSTYTGVAQQPTLEGAGGLSFKVDAYTDVARTQPASAILNAGTYYLKVYRPEDETYKAYQNDELTFIIKKADLKADDIMWPEASEIKKGDALSASKLLGGSAGVVAGVFEWVTPEQQAKEEGEQSFEVKFVPNDTKNYPERVVSTIKVKVAAAPVAVVTLDKATLSLEEGKTENLTLAGFPDGATTTWSSSDDKVATVSKEGKVTAVAAGRATIKATITTGEGTTLEVSCVVTVTKKVAPPTPSTPDTPVTPEVSAPTVAERTPNTVVVEWEKIAGADSYKLFLYADKTKKELIATYAFDKEGTLLKAGTITFTLENLTEGKSYYVETVAYDAADKPIVTKGVEIPATPTAVEDIANTEVTTSYRQIHVTAATPLTVRVVAMSGATVFAQAEVAGRIDIPVSNAGVYVVILSQANKALIHKVIVR